MKNALLLFLSLALLISCHKEDSVEPEANAYPQTWQLVKQTIPWTQTVTTGADLPYQEKYVFQADSTFTKIRQQGGQTTEASGTFTVRTESNGQFVILAFSEATSIISACRPKDLHESFARWPGDTITNTWGQCDRAQLDYKRVK